MKHTPGKWEFDKTHKYYDGEIVRHNGVVICRMHKSATVLSEERHANAALIAAAPELVAALDTLMGELQVWSCSGESRDYKWAELRVKRFRALLDKVKEKQK